MMRRKSPSDAILRELRAFGLSYPGVETKSPWRGHDDLAVNGKTFAYLGTEGEPFSVSLKLPYTGDEALQLAFAKPTGYGLGKSGWVTFEPTLAEMPSIVQLKSWIDESYRAQAPKKLAAQITYEVTPQSRARDAGHAKGKARRR
jgi:predicted DNA-binding protein (MmcQ/YjbR family)